MNREEKKIKNYFLVLFLTLITLGIYRWYWLFCIEDRLQVTGEQMGLKIHPGPGCVLFFRTFGTFVLFGPILADFFVIHNMNRLAREYNSTITKKTKVTDIEKELALDAPPVLPGTAGAASAKPALTNSKPGNPNAKPGNPNARPGNPNGKPVNPNAKSGNPNGKPVNPNAKPGNPNGKPVNPNAKPGNPNSKPVNPNAKPGNPNSKPVNPNSKPANPNAKPVKPNAKPGNTRGKPQNSNPAAQKKNK